jgi:hypothetical protein
VRFDGAGESLDCGVGPAGVVQRDRVYIGIPGVGRLDASGGRKKSECFFILLLSHERQAERVKQNGVVGIAL